MTTTPLIAANAALLVAMHRTHGAETLGATGSELVWLVKAATVSALVGMALFGYEARKEGFATVLCGVLIGMVAGPTLVAAFAMLGYGVKTLLTA